MVTKKPVLNRKQVLRREGAQREALQVLRQIARLIRSGERLGTPIRVEDRIEIPIQRTDEAEAAAAEQATLHALMQAWVE